MEVLPRERPYSSSCCICEKELRNRKRVVEVRPTGEWLELQGWTYCTECWNEMGLLRKSTINIDSLFSVVNTESGLAYI